MNSLIAIAALSMTQAVGIEASLDEVLRSAELTPSTARFDESLLRFFRKGEFATPIYQALSENPWRTPWIMDVKRKELAGYAGQPHMQLMALGQWMGWSVRRTLIGNPLEPYERSAGQRSLVEARLEGLVSGDKPEFAGLPEGTIRAAGLILYAADQADKHRYAAALAMGGVSKQHLAQVTNDPHTFVYWTEANLDDWRKFNVNTMAAGAHDLFMAVAKAQENLATVDPTASYKLEFDTRLGKVLLVGGTAQRITGDYVLIINTGNTDDVYIPIAPTQIGGRASSIIIDRGGNDKYLSDPALESTPVAQFPGRQPERDRSAGPGGALFSFSVVWDEAGNDLYRSHRKGLASGRFGFALLHDGQGNDIYDAYADSLGYGEFGAGILEDLAGDDRYEGFNQVQGCGQTSGFGYLFDAAGNDVYTGNNTVIDFGSAQDDKNNTLMGQGAGNGRRADYLEGNSLAGGLGILFDAQGDDKYSAAMFCQGVGYWEGVGALWDSAGQDEYNGAWYAMGASAHFAIGYLEDEAGDDKYVATMNMAVGAGHDFSAGILVDRQGNDSYQAPNLSLGGGNANGIGWFVDMLGNDRYQSSGITLGKAAESPSNSLRERALCLGVFMDLAGNDTFPANLTWSGDNKQTVNWTTRNPRPSESALGIFWDKN